MINEGGLQCSCNPGDAASALDRRTLRVHVCVQEVLRIGHKTSLYYRLYPESTPLEARPPRARRARARTLRHMKYASFASLGC